MDQRRSHGGAPPTLTRDQLIPIAFATDDQRLNDALVTYGSGELLYFGIIKRSPRLKRTWCYPIYFNFKAQTLRVCIPPRLGSAGNQRAEPSTQPFFRQ
jgi:hypothetical protein